MVEEPLGMDGVPVPEHAARLKAPTNAKAQGSFVRKEPS